MSLKERKTEVVYYGILITIAILIFMQLQFASLTNTLLPEYVSFYTNLAILALFILAIYLFLELIPGTPEEAQYGSLIRNDSWSVFKAPLWLRLIPIIAFAGIIAFTSLSGIQLMPIPESTTAPLSLSGGERFLTQAIIPGILEDLVFFGFISIVALLVFLGYSWLKGEMGGKWSRAGIYIMVILVLSLGSGWLVPGFASGHSVAYGGNAPSFLSAWIFSSTQQTLYFVTGIFLPIAHVLHNGLLVFKAETAFSIGSLVVLMFCFHKGMWKMQNRIINKWRYKIRWQLEKKI